MAITDNNNIMVIEHLFISHGLSWATEFREAEVAVLASIPVNFFAISHRYWEAMSTLGTGGLIHWNCAAVVSFPTQFSSLVFLVKKDIHQ